jgi:hypothetical protein
MSKVSQRAGFQEAHARSVYALFGALHRGVEVKRSPHSISQDINCGIFESAWYPGKEKSTMDRPPRGLVRLSKRLNESFIEVRGAGWVDVRAFGSLRERCP